MKRSTSIILFILAMAYTATIYFFVTSKDLKPKNKIKYCHIDSVSVIKKYDVTYETVNKYSTDCGQSFFSKNEYKIGDSIEYIIIKK